MVHSLPGSDTRPLHPTVHGRGRRWVRRVGWLLVVILLVGGWLIYRVLPYMVLRPGRSERWDVFHNCTPAEYGLTTEDMWVETQPGLWLRGWHVHALTPPVRGTIVLLHGHSSCKEAELGLAKLFAEHGYNCLLYGARAHGESGGEYCTFGFYEQRDFSHFVDESERRFGPSGPWAIFGNSMDGAVALQAMAEEPRIRCGIVESPFTTMREIVHD